MPSRPFCDTLYRNEEELKSIGEGLGGGTGAIASRSLLGVEK